MDGVRGVVSSVSVSFQSQRLTLKTAVNALAQYQGIVDAVHDIDNWTLVDVGYIFHLCITTAQELRAQYLTACLAGRLVQPDMTYVSLLGNSAHWLSIVMAKLHEINIKPMKLLVPDKYSTSLQPIYNFLGETLDASSALQSVSPEQIGGGVDNVQFHHNIRTLDGKLMLLYRAVARQWFSLGQVILCCQCTRFMLKAKFVLPVEAALQHHDPICIDCAAQTRSPVHFSMYQTAAWVGGNVPHFVIVMGDSESTTPSNALRIEIDNNTTQERIFAEVVQHFSIDPKEYVLMSITKKPVSVLVSDMKETLIVGCDCVPEVLTLVSTKLQ
jgi:hypothetical protein